MINPAAPGAKADTYGVDNRRDLHELEASADSRLLAWASSTAVVVSTGLLVPTADGFHLSASRLGDVPFNTKVGSMFGLPPQKLCASAPYVDQPAVEGCTAFLVGPDLMATAGHCLRREHTLELDESWCLTKAFVFDYANHTTGSSPLDVPAENVFYCEEVVAFALDPGVQDFALIRLSESPGREHFVLRRSGRPTVGMPVATVGHPLGVPMKVDTGGEVVLVRAEDNVFRTTLDTFYGNSGGPVINLTTGLIEGIHIEGPDSFASTDAGCLVESQCTTFNEQGVCYGSKELHAEVFAHLVPVSSSPAPRPEPEPEPEPEPADCGAGCPQDQPLNINLATAEELVELPYIGSWLANAIVTYRDQHGPYQSIWGLSAAGMSLFYINLLADRLTV